MRREIFLVNPDTGSFFAITRTGATLIERWGLLGQLEQRGQIECSSKTGADFLLESRVERKLRRGYMSPPPSERSIALA